MRVTAPLLILLSAFLLVGCATSSETKDAEELEVDQRIERVAEKDKRYTNEMGRRRSNGVSEDQAVSIYVDSLSRIDLSLLPEDIRSAYREHRQAWQDYEEVLSTPNLDLATIFNLGQALERLKLSGGMDVAAWQDLLSEIESSEGKEALRHVEKTWNEVQDLANSYGASVEGPPFRYPDEASVSVSEIEAEEGNWDPNLGGIAAPDIRLSLYVDETPMCMSEGKDSYVFSPECTFLVRPSSDLRIQVVDDDIGEPEVIGRWSGSGDQFLSLRSFEKVRRFVVDQR